KQPQKQAFVAVTVGPVYDAAADAPMPKPTPAPVVRKRSPAPANKLPSYLVSDADTEDGDQEADASPAPAQEGDQEAGTAEAGKPLAHGHPSRQVSRTNLRGLRTGGMGRLPAASMRRSFAPAGGAMPRMGSGMGMMRAPMAAQGFRRR